MSGRAFASAAIAGYDVVTVPSDERGNMDIAALKKAQARAEMYAKSLGLRVRRIVSISEGGAGMPVPMPRMAMKAEAFDGSTPVAAGESSVSVQLDVVFELGR